MAATTEPSLGEDKEGVGGERALIRILSEKRKRLPTWRGTPLKEEKTTRPQFLVLDGGRLEEEKTEGKRGDL